MGWQKPQEFKIEKKGREMSARKELEKTYQFRRN
jgi:hypothetical protein